MEEKSRLGLLVRLRRQLVESKKEKELLYVHCRRRSGLQLMAKRSVFRDFMAALKRRWRAALPLVRPLTEKRGAMPKASTFHAGIAQPLKLHVYLYFQHSNKSPGEFTINVVLAKDELAPRHWGFPEEPSPGQDFGQGPHRIGRFLETRRGDKWWRLRQDLRHEEWCRKVGIDVINEDWWCPKSYDDMEEVIRTAVEDVTRDVHITLRRLGVPATEAAHLVRKPRGT